MIDSDKQDAKRKKTFHLGIQEVALDRSDGNRKGEGKEGKEGYRIPTRLKLNNKSPFGYRKEVE